MIAPPFPLALKMVGRNVVDRGNAVGGCPICVCWLPIALGAIRRRRGCRLHAHPVTVGIGASGSPAMRQHPSDEPTGFAKDGVIAAHPGDSARATRPLFSPGWRKAINLNDRPC